MAASTRVLPSLVGKLALVLGSLLMTALLLVGVEGLLRLAGIGAPTEARASRLAYQHLSLPILRPARRPDATPILRTADLRLPYQSILAAKPAHGLRVFVLGGSAVAGLGFSPNVTFSRELERLLRTAYPDRVLEVVNLGIVALAARQVGLILEDVCENYAPDLVLVYSGNNEFLEIHAEKYAAAHATARTRAVGLLARTHLYRFARSALVGRPEPAALPESKADRSERRMTEAALIHDIEMRPEEVEQVQERYGAAIERMAETARETRTPLVLMTVASNWKWRGREDLPDDWMEEMAPADGTPEAERLRRAREVLSVRLATSPPDQRAELLFRRAVAAEEAGDIAAAREDYRAAMNADPHLRRALDGLADRVRGVARRRGLVLVDVIAGLSERAEHGIVGFDEFYDYVHFTPRGAVLVAALAFGALRDAGLLPAAEDFDLDPRVRARLQRLTALADDPLPVDEWMGFGFERARIHDRNLWKYDRLLERLDERIEANPLDVRARVYRGNSQAFRVDGAARAASDYERALELSGGDPVIRANLERLLAERSP